MQILKEQTRLIQQLLPSGAKNKPGRSMTPKYITMHNTGNTSKGADARAHASYLSSGASGQKVSWHYTVDDQVIYYSSLTAMADRVVQVKNGTVVDSRVNPNPRPVAEIEW